MKKRNFRKLQKGTSLIEIVVAAFIIVVGLLIVMSSFVAIAKSQRYSESMDMANALLRMEMERVRNLDYEDVENYDGSYFTDYLDQPGYRKEVAVTEESGTKWVRVNIWFENDRRRAQALTLVADL